MARRETFARLELARDEAVDALDARDARAAMETIASSAG